MSRTIISGVRIFDGVDLLESVRNVVIESGKFVEISTAPLDQRPQDQVFDLAGRAVIPGMVSGHFHAASFDDVGGVSAPLGFRRPPAYHALKGARNALLALEAGYTTVVSAADQFDSDVSLATAFEEGWLPGPRLIPCSRYLVTTAGSNNRLPWWFNASTDGIARVCDGPNEFQKATREEIHRGARLIKVDVSGGHLVGSTVEQAISRDELKAIVDAAHSFDARVRVHVANKRMLLMCLELGVDILDHGDGLDEECVEKLAGSGVPVLPSQYLPWQFINTYGDPEGANVPNYSSKVVESFERMCVIFDRAVKAGVAFAIGDDYGNRLLPHGSYLDELVFYESLGISSIEVLRWATANGELVAGERVGRIAVGYPADLVVIDGEPWEGVRVLARHADAVIKGGICVHGQLKSTPDSHGGLS